MAKRRGRNSRGVAKDKDVKEKDKEKKSWTSSYWICAISFTFLSFLAFRWFTHTHTSLGHADGIMKKTISSYLWRPWWGGSRKQKSWEGVGFSRCWATAMATVFRTTSRRMATAGGDGEEETGRTVQVRVPKIRSRKTAGKHHGLRWNFSKQMLKLQYLCSFGCLRSNFIFQVEHPLWTMNPISFGVGGRESFGKILDASMGSTCGWRRFCRTSFTELPHCPHSCALKSMISVAWKPLRAGKHEE